MNNTIIIAEKAQTVCRDSDWVDVARFFILNYGLHISTVLLTPGRSSAGTIWEYILCLTIPVIGITGACDAFINCARRQPDQLHVALKSSALVMVIPCEHEFKSHDFPQGMIIHGQFPASVWTAPTDAETDAGVPRWCLRVVPKSFTVTPPLGEAAVPLQLACNYSFLSAAAGIIQVLSASMQIYYASERQIPRLGYAAYSLTVVPYLFMSVVNLIACMCQPQYPAMYLVRYRGVNPPAEKGSEDDEMRLLPVKQDTVSQVEPELGATVGDAYGDLSDYSADRNWFSFYNYAFFILLAAAPYIVIAALTGFKPAHSTVSQRTWIMLWLVFGQAFLLVLIWVIKWEERRTGGGELHVLSALGGMLGAGVVVVSAVGGYVVVAQMILQDKLCFRA